MARKQYLESKVIEENRQGCRMARKRRWNKMMIYPEDLEDDSDASYGMESSFRIHSTYSRTPNELLFL